MDAKQLDETLTTIANRAKALRDSGVVGRVSVGDVSFDLASPEPVPAVPVMATQDNIGSPLDDPDTYGGHLPQRRGAPLPPPDDEE